MARVVGLEGPAERVEELGIFCEVLLNGCLLGLEVGCVESRDYMTDLGAGIVHLDDRPRVLSTDVMRMYV